MQKTAVRNKGMNSGRDEARRKDRKGEERTDGVRGINGVELAEEKGLIDCACPAKTKPLELPWHAPLPNGEML